MLERLALIDLSGLATEQDIAPAMGDFQKAMRRCRQMAMDRAGADRMTVELEVEAATLFAQLGVRACGLVGDHNELIDRVAAALLEHGELTGDGIDRIMEQR